MTEPMVRIQADGRREYDPAVTETPFWDAIQGYVDGRTCAHCGAFVYADDDHRDATCYVCVPCSAARKRQGHG